MKKFFLSLAVFVMAICANAQTNQYFWYQGNLMMGNPIAQIDSVTFGEGEPVDTLHIMLPRTIIKTVHDTIYITIHDTVCPDNIPEGALPYGFSVSPTKRVLFSKGNLQYNAALGTHQCADGTTKQGTWRFAENQWDDMGANNENISSSYSGWIDLFGWGTSGWNSGANNYQPWSCSDNNGDYYVGGSTNHDLIDDYAYADWGVYNAISNGGNSASNWRTLTNDEWDYLLNTRINANNLRGQATVNEIHGYILLPDNWITPEGLNFNVSPNNWTTNVYSGSNWEIMEKAGAVFLPASCGRGRNVYFNCLGENGSYRSASCNGGDRTNYFRFYSNDAFLHHHDLYYGHSVRLVQDIE